MKWYETHDNVTALGRWLVEEGISTLALQGYYEKPWKWSDEWQEYQRTRQDAHPAPITDQTAHESL